MADSLDGIVCEGIWWKHLHLTFYKSDTCLIIGVHGRLVHLPWATMKGAEIYEHLSVEGLVDLFRPMIRDWILRNA